MTSVESVSVALSPDDSPKSIENDNSNSFVFVFDDVDLTSSQIAISAVYEDSDEPEVVFKKLAKGNKTYTELPKSPLDGSYSLYTLLTDKSLLNNILKYYPLEALEIGKSN